MSKGWMKYTQNEVTTSNPVQVLILAYEKCIINLQLTEDKIKNLKFREADERISNTRRIITELSMQIDKDVYPELAEDLYRIYEWILKELEYISASKNPAKCEGVISNIQVLLDAYKEVLQKESNKSNG
jgi:flagellar protein FliS